MQLLREHYERAEETLGAGFQFVSPTEVARRSGISKGMLYHIWGRDGRPAFDAFVADLAERALEPLVKPEHFRRGSDDLHQTGTTLTEATLAMGDAELPALLADDERRLAFVQTLSFAAYAGCQPIRDALSSSRARSHQALAPVYEYVFTMYGRRIRRSDGPGRALDYVDLARIISMLTDGFAMTALHTPEVLAADLAWAAGECEAPHSAFSIALLALIDGLTEPIPDREA